MLFFLWQLTKLNENFNCSDFSKLKWWCLMPFIYIIIYRPSCWTRKVLLNTHRSEQHGCQPSANIIANVNCEYSEQITTKDRESLNFWRLYVSLYSGFTKVTFSNACLVPIATFFKHGLPHLQARVSNLQARPCLCRHVKLGPVYLL